MLVSSFDTKYSKPAFKYESLDNNFISILSKNNISKFITIFKNTVKSPYKLNLEKNFFSKDYHQDIFFYVYSSESKKLLAQGGGYQYFKNKKNIEGFGFSCNVDNLADLI